MGIGRTNVSGGVPREMWGQWVGKVGGYNYYSTIPTKPSDNIITNAVKNDNTISNYNNKIINYAGYWDGKHYFIYETFDSYSSVLCIFEVSNSTASKIYHSSIKTNGNLKAFTYKDYIYIFGNFNHSEGLYKFNLANKTLSLFKSIGYPHKNEIQSDLLNGRMYFFYNNQYNYTFIDTLERVVPNGYNIKLNKFGATFNINSDKYAGTYIDGEFRQVIIPYSANAYFVSNEYYYISNAPDTYYSIKTGKSLTIQSSFGKLTSVVQFKPFIKATTGEFTIYKF